MQFHLGTNASGGVSAHSSSYSCSMRSTQLRGPEDSAGERSGQEARLKLRLRRPLPARSEHYTMVEEEAAAAGSGGGSGRRAKGAP